jgi:hypothetical protein
MRWLELVAQLMQGIDSQIGVSRVLLVVLLLEIYRMHALMVFVAL